MLSVLLALGADCPALLAAGLEGGTALHDAVKITGRPLLATPTCTVHVCSLLVAAGASDGGGCHGTQANQAHAPQQCVVKSYHKHRLEPAELQQVQREIHIHQQLHSEHVVPFWAAVEDGAALHIVSSYCGQGDLRSMLAAAQGPLCEALVRDQVVLPLLLALHELHGMGLVHRDVKPDNVFMAGDSAMLGDFGLAVACGDAADAQGSGSMHTDTAAAAGATNAISCAQLSAPLLQRLAVRARRGSDSSNCSSAVLTPTSASSAGSADLDAVLVLPKGSSCNDSGSGVGGAAPAGRRVSSLDSCKAVSAAMAAGSAHAGGTPAYVAPEVVQAAFNQVTLAEVLAPQNDVWSLGVLVLECLSGRHPFGGPCVPAGQVLAAISSSKCLQLSCLPVSPQCRDWLAAALARDPRQRWSVAQLLQHPWLHEQLPPPPHGQQGAGPAAAAAAAAGAACVPGGAASVDGGDAVACRDHSTKRRQGGWSAAAGAVSQLASDDGCGCAAGDATPAAAAAAAAAETASSGSAALLQRCGLGGITSWED